jgi:hypothetical protein
LAANWEANEPDGNGSFLLYRNKEKKQAVKKTLQNSIATFKI